MISDELLKEAACEFDKAMLDSISPTAIPDHVFSEAFEKDFAQLSRKTNWLLANKLLTTVAIWTIVCVCILSLGVGITHAAIQHSKDQQMGQYYAELQSGGTGTILAKYEDFEIDSGAVEYRRHIDTLLTVPKHETDLTIINRIIQGKMLLDEAERLGLSATQDEIEALIENSRYTYTLPDGKKRMDDFCQGAGITIEEYFDLLEDQLPEMIASNKLKNEYARLYCKENGLEYLQGNSTPEIEAAVEAKLNELFEQHKHKIQYFIDTED